MGDFFLLQPWCSKPGPDWTQTVVLQVHDWVFYKLGVLLGSVGHKVKIHKITPTTGKERGDIEIKDYVSLQKTHGQFFNSHTQDGQTVFLIQTLC